MRRIAIIPAREGSKRLPLKNIRDLNGHPIISYVISNALKSGLFDDVFVSTESIIIARVAEIYGAKVFKRSEDLAQDRSTVNEVCLELLEEHESDEFCCIYATAAFLEPSDLQMSLELLDDDTDCVMGVSSYDLHPVQALVKDDSGNLSYMWPQYKGVQSQFYPDLCVSNGTLYWAKSDSYKGEKTFYVEKLKGYPVSSEKAIDIDYEEDFIKAQKLATAIGLSHE